MVKKNLLFTVLLMLIANYASAKQRVLDSITQAPTGNKTTFKYNSFGSLTEKETYYSKTDGTGIYLYSKQTNEYDDTNNLTVSLNFLYSTTQGELQLSNKREYKYDDQNRQILYIHSRKNTDGILMPWYKEDDTYTNDKHTFLYSEYKNDKWQYVHKTETSIIDGNTTSITSNSSDGTADTWVLFGKSIYIETDDGKLIYDYKIAEGTADTWVEASMEKQTNDNEGRLLEKVKSKYDTDKKVYVPDTKTEIEFDTFGNKVSDIEYMNLGDTEVDWSILEENYTTYNDNGYLLKFESYLSWFSDHQLSGRTIYEPDERGNSISKTTYQCSTESAEYKPEFKYEYTYIEKTNDDVLIAEEKPKRDFINTVTTFEYVNEAWVQKSVDTYHYTVNDGTSVAVSLTNNTPKLRVFPNPASDMLTIELNITEINASQDIIIYNAVGTEMYRGIAKSKLETLNVSNFAPGVYLVRVGNNVIRFIKR